MKETVLTVNDPAGMHARPAGELAKTVKNHPGTAVTLDNGVRKVSAGSILSILSLGLKCGAAVTVCADGPDEDAVLGEISALLSRRQ